MEIEEIIYICRTMANVLHNVLLAMFRPIQRLPLKYHYFWGRGFAWLAGKVAGYRKDVVTVNLSRSFPALKYKQLKQLTQDFYGHLGEVFAETIWLGGCRGHKDRFYRNIKIDVDGLAPLCDDFRKGSVMVLSGHFGNWELIGGYMQTLADRSDTFTEDDVAVVYRGLHNEFSEEFFRRNRTAIQKPGFSGYVESRVVMRYVVRHKDQPKIYLFPTDQSPYGTAVARHTLEFLHQPTEAMMGGAILAAKLGMPVYYLGADRTARSVYRLRLVRICDPSDGLSPEATMERFYALLEEDINRNPANYLWSHKRWK